MNPRPAGFSVLEFLQSQNREIPSAFQTEKFKKLLTSPFVFYRGTDQLYFRDWTNNTALNNFGNSSTATWTQADLHIENFGSFADDKGDVIYEMNDFDESCVQSYQHDVWKLATSLVLVARELKLSDKVAGQLVQTLAAAYKDQVKGFAGGSHGAPEKTQFDSDTTKGILKDFLQGVTKSKSRVKMLNSWTVLDQRTGRRMFNLSNPDLRLLDDGTKAAIANGMAFYKFTLTGPLRNPAQRGNPNYFNIQDMALRLNAGTGSTGKNRYYVLVEGASASPDDDVILDVKQGGRPVPFSFFQGDRALQYKVWFPTRQSEGVRHDAAYRAVSTNTDNAVGHILLPLVIPEYGINDAEWIYFVRERNPWKATWEYLTDGNAETLTEMCGWWGQILATQHSRAGSQFRDGVYVDVFFPDQFDALTSGKKDEFVAQVQQVAFLYANQVQSDFSAFTQEFVAGGRAGQSGPGLTESQTMGLVMGLVSAAIVAAVAALVVVAVTVYRRLRTAKDAETTHLIHH